MQICKACGKPIKYVAVNGSEYAVVDPELVEVYTENGYKHKAYIKHKCSKEKPEETNAGE